VYKVLGADLHCPIVLFKVSALTLASKSPLAILLQQFFSLQQAFPFSNYFQKPPTPKSQKPKSQTQKPKAQSLMSFFSESFIPSGKQGGAATLGEGRDIVTGETCLPASLNVNNLGKAAVLHFPLLWPGLCQSWPTDKHLRKSC
jgi:hypothetical protein